MKKMKDTAWEEVKAPQMGANEDFAVVREWKFEKGEKVQSGDVIAVLETTKATFEVDIDQGGFIYPLHEEDYEVEVEEPIALLCEEKKENIVKSYKEEKKRDTKSEESLKNVKLTEEAKKYVKKEEVDTSILPDDKILRKKDIINLTDSKDRKVGKGNERKKSWYKKDVVIVGAGNGGLAYLETLEAMSEFRPVAFLDQDTEKVGTQHGGLPVWSQGSIPRLKNEKGVEAIVVAVANGDRRLEIIRFSQSQDLHVVNAIHQEAWIAPSVTIGEGSFIKAGAVVETQTRIDDACIVDNGAVIPHHCSIDKAAHIAPGVSMGGNVKIGSFTLVGVGATIAPSIEVGDNVIISPGSAVNHDIPSGVIAGGSPAEIIGSRN